MSSSVKGYIDDPVKAEKIIDDFMNSTLGELTVPGYDTKQFGIRLLNDTYSASYVRHPEDICFSQLLALTGIRSENTPEFWSNIKDLLCTVQGHVGKARLFMSVTLKALTDFVNRKTNSIKGSRTFNGIKERAENCLDFNVTDTTTVGQLFRRFGAMTRWNNRFSLKEYEEHVLDCCSIIRLAMDEYFRDVYDFGEFKRNLEELKYWDSCDFVEECEEEEEEEVEYDYIYPTIDPFDHIEDFGIEDYCEEDYIEDYCEEDCDDFEPDIYDIDDPMYPADEEPDLLDEPDEDESFEEEEFDEVPDWDTVIETINKKKKQAV